MHVFFKILLLSSSLFIIGTSGQSSIDENEGPSCDNVTCPDGQSCQIYLVKCPSSADQCPTASATCEQD